MLRPRAAKQKETVRGIRKGKGRKGKDYEPSVEAARRKFRGRIGAFRNPRAQLRHIQGRVDMMNNGSSRLAFVLPAASLPGY